MRSVTVVGAGLAGCEAAWQLAKRGLAVTLVEMKPLRFSPAHHMEGFAELVCSNSLKAEHLGNASGLLKAELAQMDSLILASARAARVPAGTALAVDRDAFSQNVTRAIAEEPLIRVERRIVSELPEPPCIVATGPLTDGPLAEAIQAKTGVEALRFFDAAAPIVTAESLDMDKVFRASRYGLGDDYLNCPLDEGQYRAFYEALMQAECAPLHEFDRKQVYEGCLAVEILASRGYQTLAFGPLKPIGLTDPRTGRRPYAVVQLRRENEAGTLYNMVGFQTRLKFGEQKRVFSLIPGLERAEFARYGVMHRNTYLEGPKVLGANYAWREEPLVRFAGQLAGVEGYMESTAAGLVAGIALAGRLRGEAEIDFTGRTILGALARYARTPNADYQPMNGNFGLLDALDAPVRDKKIRYERLAARSLETLSGLMEMTR